jgi:hypothetical protein
MAIASNFYPIEKINELFVCISMCKPGKNAANLVKRPIIEYPMLKKAS